MRFYRVDYSSAAITGSMGFTWHTRKREAEQRARAFLRERADEGEEPPFATADVEAVDVEPTKRGILSALRIYATHPDNG